MFLIIKANSENQYRILYRNFLHSGTLLFLSKKKVYCFRNIGHFWPWQPLCIRNSFQSSQLRRTNYTWTVLPETLKYCVVVQQGQSSWGECASLALVGSIASRPKMKGVNCYGCSKNVPKNEQEGSLFLFYKFLS